MKKVLNKKIKWHKCFLNIYLNENNNKYTAKIEGTKCFDVFNNKHYEQDVEALDAAEVLVFKKLGWYVK